MEPQPHRAALWPHHQREAKKNRDTAEGRLATSIKETYRWLLAPVVEVTARGQLSEVMWEAAELDLHGTAYAKAIAEVANASDWVIARWAPAHLRDELARWYWKEDRSEVSALRVWDDFGKQLYLPRLQARAVFEQTVRDGVEHRDFFGYAAGVKKPGEPGEYEGLLFGHGGAVYLEDSAVLIEPGAAQAAQDRSKPPVASGPGRAGAAGGHDPAAGGREGRDVDGGDSEPAGEPDQGGSVAAATGMKKRRFHATMELSPLRAAVQFGDIMDEVIERFTDEYGTQVNITVDIEAERPAGFDPALQRTIKENCATLKFKHAEFEDE